MRAPSYDVVFIDGLHTPEQLVSDFAAVEARLAQSAIVVLHDVGWWDLRDAVVNVSRGWRCRVVSGRAYKNLVGTVLLYRGFDDAIFEGI
eukprot:TRINITY_DN25254_c1_g1_i1.p1 TRINITY_DN25254_c1_g1~~TRINITY_DN25254_c1_g1_i1.p1  ORF type:complete len:101 (-),score=10.44 TRINITY_DN25254_c1_g1_i1:295-564(-)